MTLVVRLLALALLAVVGYAAYERAPFLQSALSDGGLAESLDSVSLDRLVIDGLLMASVTGVALIVLTARQTARNEGEKPRFRFGGFARFLAAITFFGGVRGAANASFNFYRARDVLDQVLSSPGGPRAFGVEGIKLAIGLTSIVLALLVLFSPRKGA